MGFSKYRVQSSETDFSWSGLGHGGPHVEGNCSMGWRHDLYDPGGAPSSSAHAATTACWITAPLSYTVYKRTQTSIYYQADSYLLSIHLTVSFSDNYSPFSLQCVPMLLRRRDAGCKHWIQIFYWPIRYCEFICAVVVFICYFASYQENTVWWCCIVD